MLEFLQRHGAQLVVGAAAVTALAFPATAAGGASLVLVVGALGVAVLELGPRLSRRLPTLDRGVTGAIAIGVVIVASAAIFGRVFHDPAGWTMGDWGPQHAVLTDVIDGLRAGHVPRWTHHLSTGEAPLETYPALTYLVAAVGAMVTGMADDLPRYLLGFAVVVHTLVAVGITRLALRVAPPAIACLLGLTQLIDAGGISAGGVDGNIEWALVHSALGQALLLLAVAAVCDAIARPRLRTTVAIWLFTALAAATHPSALLTGGALVVALIGVGLVAVDVPARRSLVAAGHVAIGLALAAVVWMPLGERLVLYGQHFPSAPRTPRDLLDGLLQWPAPATTFAPIMYLGYAGLVAAVASRRALPVLLGATGLLLLLGLVDTPYLVLHTGPSTALARLGAERFHALSRPFVVAGAAYALAVGWRAIRRRWAGASIGQRRLGAAIVAVGVGLGLRACVPYAGDRAGSAVAEAERAADDRGEAELLAWARAAAATNTPDHYGRALFELGDTHYIFHLAAETGLPTLHMNAIANLLLRERMEDTSAASLRRFAIRWVVIADDTDAPPRADGVELADWERPDPTTTAKVLALGDPATERRFGRYVVREVPGWDGALARVERGAGAVRVTRLDPERVEVELTGTDQPALVALGIGFYPRWQARDATGRRVPVYALPATPSGRLHVLSAWVRPGTTVLTCDAALPSDGAGRGVAGLAALAAVAGLVVWSRRRWRVRALRKLARILAWVRARRGAVVGGVAGAIAVVLPIAGALRSCAPARGLEVGVGLRGTATVMARPVGARAWEECGYARLAGRYECPGIAAVSDVVAGVVNDPQPAWPFTAPAIRMVPMSMASAEVRVEIDARLAGTYWLGARGGAALVSLDGDPATEVTRQRELALGDRGPTRVRVEAVVSGEGTTFAFLRGDTVEPDRPFLAPPPDLPPAR